MSTMSKLYLICLDAMPWGDDLAAFAGACGLQPIVTMNCGTFTHTSVLGRLTGRLPSDLVAGGIGLQSARLERFHGWREHSLFQRLGDRGWGCIVHNNIIDGWLSYLAAPVPTDRVAALCRPAAAPAGRREPWEARREFLERAWPRLRITTSGEGAADFEDWADAAACEAFYGRERAYIRDLQAMPGPLFFYTDSTHYHQVHYYLRDQDLGAARRATLAWLAGWDLEEADAVFCIFSDHGTACEVEAPPRDHVTWTLLRDNRRGEHRAAPVIAGTDVYALACDVAGLDDGGVCRSPYEPVDYDRTYFLEDAREAVSPFESTTAAATRITEWSDDGRPLALTQLSWMRHLGRYAAFTAPLEAPDRCRAIPVDFRNEVQRELRDALRERISWMRADPPPALPLGPLRRWLLQGRRRRDEHRARHLRLD